MRVIYKARNGEFYRMREEYLGNIVIKLTVLIIV